MRFLTAMALPTQLSPAKNEIAIALGTNLGNRLANLRRAHAMLAQWPEAHLTETAPVYQTLPIDVPPEFTNQLFLNSIVLIKTAADPERVLDMAHAIEQGLGRDRTNEPRNGPRAIDLDLIYAGNRTINRPGLRLPHPRWTQRAFVVRPLADLRPHLILPGETRDVITILNDLNAQKVRQITDYPWWLKNATD